MLRGGGRRSPRSRSPRSATRSSAAAAARFAFVPKSVAAAVTAFDHFALVDPNLDADHAIGRVRLAETVINIGAQRVQRQLTLQIPFASGDFSAIQAAGNTNLDAFAAKAQRRIDRSYASRGGKPRAFQAAAQSIPKPAERRAPAGALPEYR